MLRGKIFIDDNYDGIEQPEENKAVSVLVSVKGTGLSLNTTPTGNFTIQNLNPGLYELGISLDNLPLGWAVDENAVTRFSIAPEQITEIKVPIRKVYGLTGQVVSAQENLNEGLTVEILKSNESVKKTLTTFGGQFSFDGLKPDKYTLRLYDINEKAYNQEITLDQAINKKYLFELKN